jgi:hypothetical protein
MIAYYTKIAIYQEITLSPENKRELCSLLSASDNVRHQFTIDNLRLDLLGDSIFNLVLTISRRAHNVNTRASGRVDQSRGAQGLAGLGEVEAALISLVDLDDGAGTLNLNLHLLGVDNLDTGNNVIANQTDFLARVNCDGFNFALNNDNQLVGSAIESTNVNSVSNGRTRNSNGFADRVLLVDIF